MLLLKHLHAVVILGLKHLAPNLVLKILMDLAPNLVLALNLVLKFLMDLVRKLLVLNLVRKLLLVPNLPLMRQQLWHQLVLL